MISAHVNDWLVAQMYISSALGLTNNSAADVLIRQVYRSFPSEMSGHAVGKKPQYDIGDTPTKRKHTNALGPQRNKALIHIPVASSDVVRSSVGFRATRLLTAFDMALRCCDEAFSPFDVPAASSRIVCFRA